MAGYQGGHGERRPFGVHRRHLVGLLVHHRRNELLGVYPTREMARASIAERGYIDAEDVRQRR